MQKYTYHLHITEMSLEARYFCLLGYYCVAISCKSMWKFPKSSGVFYYPQIIQSLEKSEHDFVLKAMGWLGDVSPTRIRHGLMIGMFAQVYHLLISSDSMDDNAGGFTCDFPKKKWALTSVERSHFDVNMRVPRFCVFLSCMYLSVASDKPLPKICGHF